MVVANDGETYLDVASCSLLPPGKPVACGKVGRSASVAPFADWGQVGETPFSGSTKSLLLGALLTLSVAAGVHAASTLPVCQSLAGQHATCISQRHKSFAVEMTEVEIEISQVLKTTAWTFSTKLELAPEPKSVVIPTPQGEGDCRSGTPFEVRCAVPAGSARNPAGPPPVIPGMEAGKKVIAGWSKGLIAYVGGPARVDEFGIKRNSDARPQK